MKEIKVTSVLEELMEEYRRVHERYGELMKSVLGTEAAACETDGRLLAVALRTAIEYTEHTIAELEHTAAGRQS